MLVAVVGCSPLFAEDKAFEKYNQQSSAKVKRAAWAISVETSQPNLEGTEGNDLHGTMASIQIGGGYFAPTWFGMGSADIILGPFGRSRDENIKTDFNGSGFSAWTGYRLLGGSLRENSGTYGLAFGAKYYEVIGRSVSKSPTQALASGSERSIDDYVVRARNIALSPGIFAAWLKKERVRGNTPDLLVTRVEGYILLLGVSYPVEASYTAKFKETTAESDGSHSQTKTIKQNGVLTGHSYILSFSALLGV